MAAVTGPGRASPSAHSGRPQTPAGAAPAVGPTDSEVVYTEAGLELHRYEPPGRRHHTPVVAVYALINRPYILDLEPDRSVVRRLLEAGFPVYLIDWGEPSRLDASLGLRDYVGRYLNNCVEATLADAGADDCHLLGYCMGGTMAAIYAALDDATVRTLTTVATPFAFEGTGGLLERWTTNLDVDVLLDRDGLVPRELLATAFAMLDPVENTLGKALELYERVDDPAAVATFCRLERWIWDGVDVPGGVFREFAVDLYDQNRLADGSLTVAGERVDPASISVPHQHLVGADDNLVPPASTRPLAWAIDHGDGRVIEFSSGHVGLTVSRAAHDTLWPDAAAWLAERSAPGATDGSAIRTDRDAGAAAVEAVADRGARAVSADGGAAVDARPVESVRGIGPTYARRLAAAGIETVADLHERNAASLAAAAAAPETLAGIWLERVE